MQIYVSYSFVPSNPGSLQSLILLEDVRYLLEQINKHCENIPVAKVNPPPSSESSPGADYMVHTPK